jgi:hypothetical protein
MVRWVEYQLATSTARPPAPTKAGITMATYTAAAPLSARAKTAKGADTRLRSLPIIVVMALVRICNQLQEWLRNPEQTTKSKNRKGFVKSAKEQALEFSKKNTLRSFRNLHLRAS